MYYDYDCVLYKGTSMTLWGWRTELGRKLRQNTSNLLGRCWVYYFVQWRSHSVTFPLLFPSHTDIKIIGSLTQLYKPKSPYMQNMVICCMFSHRVALLINEIMTIASFEIFELRNSINKRPYYFTTLVTN